VKRRTQTVEVEEPKVAKKEELGLQNLKSLKLQREKPLQQKSKNLKL